MSVVQVRNYFNADTLRHQVQVFNGSLAVFCDLAFGGLGECGQEGALDGQVFVVCVNFRTSKVLAPLLSSVDFHTERKILNVCGPQISRCRNQLGWSQAQLAAKCQLAGWDVSRDIIARIELQIRWVGDFELAALALVLNVPLISLHPEPTRRKLGRISQPPQSS